MPRKKLLSDRAVLKAARQLYAGGGGRALSFGSLSRATGLAASTLAQRYGTIDGLQSVAARDGWAALTEALAACEVQAADKGPQGYLRALGRAAQEAALLLALGVHDQTAAQAGAQWRRQVEAGLAIRLGQGEKAQAAARILFSTWQGMALWQNTSLDSGLDWNKEGEIKLKDLAKRLI